jgi:hypothetical protein
MPRQLDTAAGSTPTASGKEQKRARTHEDTRRRQAERVPMPNRHGLVIPFQAESILRPGKEAAGSASEVQIS